MRSFRNRRLINAMSLLVANYTSGITRRRMNAAPNLFSLHFKFFRSEKKMRRNFSLVELYSSRQGLQHVFHIRSE
jgi:hypothetical protein